MVSTAVAALISLLSFFFAAWGLHLRLKSAQAHWKEEAVMLRRRSLAMSAAGIDADKITGQVRPPSSNSMNKRVSWMNDADSAEYTMNRGGSITKHPNGTKEQLDVTLEDARRNSREQEAMIRRAS